MQDHTKREQRVGKKDNESLARVMLLTLLGIGYLFLLASQYGI